MNDPDRPTPKAAPAAASGRGPGSFLTAGSGRTLVDQIVVWYTSRSEERVLRPGTRMPSIRGFAAEHRVSRFTVVESYDRLIARGCIESRRGSGFFVRERDLAAGLASARAWADAPNPTMDVVWLLRNMFRQLPSGDMPGGGVLPADWLDGDLVGAVHGVPVAAAFSFATATEAVSGSSSESNPPSPVAVREMTLSPTTIWTHSAITMKNEALIWSRMA
jgi:DNA-binding transcriptional regulator YhcF (GntR family)